MNRRSTAVSGVERACERIMADGRDGVWITLESRSRALDAARAIDERPANQLAPLAGWTMAVKDNIDVVGLPTTAACRPFAYDPPSSAPVVQQLVAAGAVVIGKTNMDQFATGLVGTRSPYGICPNAHWPGLIAGGSSSGSAVAVAAGLVDVGLGTDTAGSGRVPAACNGIVGLKPSRGRISNRGVVPACRSLDCVSIFTRTVADATRVAEVLLEPVSCDSRSWRLAGFPFPTLDFDGDTDAAARFGTAFGELTRCYPLQEIDFAPFRAAARLLYDGAFVAERYEAVGEFITTHRDDADPTVASIIEAAATIPAWQLFRDQLQLDQLRRVVDDIWTGFDFIVAPTVPRIPTVAEVLASPISCNSMLGTYTNFVNLLDLCALTVPVDHGTTASPPTSITLIGRSGADGDLLAFANSCELISRQ